MPYKPENYHYIPETIIALNEKLILQHAFIETLSQNELGYLVTEAKEGYPLDIIAKHCNPCVLTNLSEKIFETAIINYRKDQKIMINAGLRYFATHDISYLLREKNGITLLHLLAYFGDPILEVVLNKISKETSEEKLSDNNLKKINQITHLKLIHNDVSNSNNTLLVLIADKYTQDSSLLYQFLSLLSNETLYTLLRDDDVDGDISNFAYIAEYHSSKQIYELILKKLSDEQLFYIIFSNCFDSTFIYASRNPHDAFSLLVNRIRQNPFHVHKMIEPLLDQIDSDDIPELNKILLREMQDNDYLFIKSPREAIKKNPQSFIHFVANHLNRPLKEIILLPKWIELLTEAMDACSDLAVKDQLLVLQGKAYLLTNAQSNEFRKDCIESATATFRLVSHVENLSVEDNEFVSAYLLGMGPLVEKDEIQVTQRESKNDATLSDIFDPQVLTEIDIRKEGLKHLKEAVIKTDKLEAIGKPEPREHPGELTSLDDAENKEELPLKKQKTDTPLKRQLWMRVFSSNDYCRHILTTINEEKTATNEEPVRILNEKIDALNQLQQLNFHYSILKQQIAEGDNMKSSFPTTSASLVANLKEFQHQLADSIIGSAEQQHCMLSMQDELTKAITAAKKSTHHFRAYISSYFFTNDYLPWLTAIEITIKSIADAASLSSFVHVSCLK